MLCLMLGILWASLGSTETLFPLCLQLELFNRYKIGGDEKKV